MKPITMEFWRIGAEAGTTGPADVKAHRDRAALLQGIEKTLGIKVKIPKAAQAKQPPNEVVEVIIALTPIVVVALATLIKLWIKSKRLEKVVIIHPNGTRVEVGSGTVKQITSMLKSVWD